MKLKELIQLMQHNSDPRDWCFVPQQNGTTGFCVEDVNLRMALLVVKTGTKEQLEIQIQYATTIILSFLLPSPGASEHDQFLQAFGRSLERLTEIHQTRTSS
jgi:hypothetical protein